MKLILFQPKLFCILFMNNMANRVAQIDKLYQEIDRLFAIYIQTSDPHVEEAIQDNITNLIAGIHALQRAGASDSSSSSTSAQKKPPGNLPLPPPPAPPAATA